MEPLREAASSPWKQPSRLFVLLQIYGGVTDLDGCSSPRAARYSRGGEFWKVISSQICECSRLQDLRWLSILKPLRRSGSHSASATMKSTPVSAISFDEHLCGREEELCPYPSCYLAHPLELTSFVVDGKAVSNDRRGKAALRAERQPFQMIR